MSRIKWNLLISFLFIFSCGIFFWVQIQADNFSKGQLDEYLRSIEIPGGTNSWRPLITDIEINPYDENIAVVMIVFRDVTSSDKIFQSISNPYMKVQSTEYPFLEEIGLIINREIRPNAYIIRYMNYLLLYHPLKKDMTEKEILSAIHTNFSEWKRKLDELFGTPEKTLKTYENSLYQSDNKMALQCMTFESAEKLGSMVKNIIRQIREENTGKQYRYITEKKSNFKRLKSYGESTVDMKLVLTSQKSRIRTSSGLVDYLSLQSAETPYRLIQDGEKWEIDFMHEYKKWGTEAVYQKNIDLVQSDLRNLASVLEIYFIDWNHYPSNIVPSLTTPIPYLFEIPKDPFHSNQLYQYDSNTNVIQPYYPDSRYLLWSFGPDTVNQNGLLEYDPSNGSLSLGDIIRLQK